MTARAVAKQKTRVKNYRTTATEQGPHHNVNVVIAGAEQQTADSNTRKTNNEEHNEN